MLILLIQGFQHSFIKGISFVLWWRALIVEGCAWGYTHLLVCNWSIILFIFIWLLWSKSVCWRSKCSQKLLIFRDLGRACWECWNDIWDTTLSLLLKCSSTINEYFTIWITASIRRRIFWLITFRIGPLQWQLLREFKLWFFYLMQILWALFRFSWFNFVCWKARVCISLRINTVLESFIC